MPILSRYMLKQFAPTFVMALSVFVGVLLMNHFLRLFNVAIMKGISPFWIAGCFARLLPFIASLALPMSFLVAMLLTLGQLSEQGEITALRASGFSFGEMVWPFLAVGTLLSALLLYVNHKAAPEGFHSFREQYLDAARQLARVDLEAGAFVKLGSWKLYSREVEPETGKLKGVYLVRNEGGGKTLRINAARGRLSIERGRGVALELEDGDLQLPNNEPSRFTSGSFKRYTVEVPLTGQRPNRDLDIQEMNTATLRRKLREPATTPQHQLEYLVEIAVRSAGALTPFVFFWVAAPLGMSMGRHSRGLAFAASLGVLFGFYALLSVGIGVGRRERSLASAAPWVGNIACLALGARLTRRSMRL
jgi:lipopolysaccharide export system permease protein